jgi:putative aldouronate transport system permease protein
MNEDRATGRTRQRRSAKGQLPLQLIMIAASVWAVAIFYLPLLGNIVAFQDFEVYKGFAGSRFVGFKHFAEFVRNSFTLVLLRNTVAMSALGLVFGTSAAVVFALVLNEVYHVRFKKAVQTVSYLPYFVSMVVCANLFIQLLGRQGPVNQLIAAVSRTHEPFPFLERERLFWYVITAQGIWKNVGWNAIIYIAAIASIPQEMYEAAIVDGAGRMARMRRITLPSILPTVIVLLILNSGHIIQGGFEQQYLMYNPMVMNYAEVISTYVYKRGLQALQYSFSTAVGMMQSVVSIALLLTVNKVAKKLAGFGLW